MAYFAVTYDLKEKEIDDYEDLINQLKKMKSVRYQESCWFVEQNKTAQEVCNALKPYIHDDDKLMVIEFTERPAMTKRLKGTRAWLDARF
jgi:CRISPR-associated endonuclease Cas2